MIQNEDHSLTGEKNNTRQNRGKSQDYWLKRFSGEFVRNSFHYDYKENVPNIRIIDSVDFRFSGKIFSKLMSFSNGSDTNLFKVLTAGLVVILGKTTFTQNGIKDITVGTSVLFKHGKGIEKKPINTVLALRNQFEENIKFKELVTKVGETIDEAQEHKDLPVEKIPNQLKMQVFGDDFPLFDVAISLENIQDRRYLRHLNVNMIFSFFKTAKYIDGVVEYNSSLYEKTSIKKIIAHFTNLLQLALADINGKKGVSDIDILSEEEKQQLLYDFSGGDVDYPKNLTVQELFEAQVEKVPGKIALVFENLRISFGELNRRANRVAWELKKKKVGADGVVPMMVERSTEALVAIMGIIKAGAGYLPIVVDNPKERIRGIINDSDAKVMVTRKKYVELAQFTGEAIHMEDKSLFEGDSSNPPLVTSPQGLMYVIYTSGSTGKPKGVMLDQDNFINLLFFQWDEIGVNFSGRILQFASLGFDVSAQEIFSTLLGQGTLHLTSDEQKHDALRLFKYIQKNLVEIIFIPPAFLKFVFSDTGIAEKFPVCIKHLIAAGEQLLVTEGLETYLRKHSAFLHNHYGPTESHVVTTLKMGPKGEIPEAPSIGKPITNNNILILGRDNHIMQPMGIPGELYITGANVARGYSNRPELTYERFMMNPYKKGERMYRTGDLARWLPDGNIDYLGRIDFQVKIRGFRIEIGEIESQLLRCDRQEIKEAVVLAREESGGGDKYLCAYIVSDENIDTSALNNFLTSNLPDYMIPSYFVKVDKIPLNQNGKVDQRKLPDPKSLGRQERYVPPRNVVEKALVDIWARVLNMKKDNISIDDNFFKLGGHSLKAAMMIATVHKVLNVKISIYDIFENPTITELSQCMGGDREEEYASINLAECKEFYLQTSAQKRLYFIDRLEKNSILYNIQLMDIYCKGVDKDSLEQAFKGVIKRHESLRTSFHTIEGKAIQKIHDFEDLVENFKIEYFETAEDGLVYLTDTGHHGKAVPFMEVVESFVRPFDLEKPPLIRVGLIKIWGNTQILMMDMHHIISDGISLEVLVNDLWALYDGEECPGLKVQYRDFSQWVNSDKQKAAINKQEEYWLHEFSGEVPVLNLPTDYSRPVNMTFDGDSIYFEIGKEETGKLNFIGQEQGATLYMVLLAVYNVLLAKLSGQEEIVVGTVSAGRSHADLHKLIGMFVETLVIRNNPAGNKTFKDFLADVKKKTLGAFANQNYPFEQLVSKVSSRKDKSRNPLFDVVFSFENEAERSDEYLLDVLMLDKSNPYNFKIKKAKFDMTLIAAETEDGVHCTIEYNTQLFKEETITRFIGYFRKIVSAVCKNSQQKISGIDIWPDLERGLLLYSFNDTETEYPKNKIYSHLFEKQVAKTPGNTALVGMTLCAERMAQSAGDLECSTYKELNEKVNQMAQALRAKGMKTDDIAAVMVESSQEMIIALIGILKAGGAFLPIKDGTPADRTEYILQESGTRFLLTRNQLLEGISFNGEIIQLDNPKIYSGDKENPRHVNTPGDLAYVIYTSGSTGKPKGVMIIHHTLINLCSWHNKYYSVTSKDHATKYAGFGFDASVWEIFPYFISGAALYIVPEEIKLDIHALNRYFQDNRITISFLPTQLCEQFMTVENNSLRALLTGGDKLKTFVKKNYQLYNNYGPTENTVVTTSCPVIELTTNIPIGKPLHNNQVYILDKNNHLQPIGVPGELSIGGDSLARGYLNNPELTEEKFVESPFKHLTPWAQYPKIYRTGDLARWLADGNIEFLGRIDYQVKVRGFRIELGEIENQLLRIEDINEAVVIAREDTPGQKHLAAYLVSNKTIDLESLKQALVKKLPNYMVPSFFMQIEQIPLNPNGKIDTKALPAPQVKSVEYAAPSNETEEILVDAWAEVLGIDKVGIDDNFFDVGGDSIKTILISGKLLKRKLSTDVNDFFSYPTIRQLAKQIKKVERLIDQGPVSGEVVLTPILKWFFEREFREKQHFNHFVLLYSKERYDEKSIKKVFAKIVEHHDALRMVYIIDENTAKVTQRNREPGEGKLFDLEFVNLMEKTNVEMEIEKRKHINRINREINLATGSLVKLALFRTPRGDYLLVVIHHTVVDGISWRILIEDLKTGFQQVEKGEEIIFQDKTDSFKNWANKLKEYADSSNALRELEYWGKLEETSVKELPGDQEVGNETRKLGNQEVVLMNVDKKKTDHLLREVNWVYNTEINDILLTALGMAVKEWTGNEKVLINLEGHGREGIIPGIDTSRTVGWFTSQYPVILDMKALSPDDLGTQIKQVKETLRCVPNKGIGYGILRYLTSKEKKGELTFKLQPEISFNYLGQLGETRGDSTSKFHPHFEPSMSSEYNAGYALDIYGSVGTEGLSLLFNYNKCEYKRTSIERVVKYYKTTLLKIIDHCMKNKKKILSLGMSAMDYHIKKDTERYLQKVQSEEWPDLTVKKAFSHIMLTGATGFLGAHLVLELLENTKAKLYLPVRAATKENAEERLKTRLVFYFGDDLYQSQKHRLVALKSELSEDKLALEDAQYEKLCETVETVVHPAANVKHFGLYEELYKDNVLGTQRLLEFSLNGKKKDFHYVSTLDTGYGNIPGKDYLLFTEYCLDEGQEIDNIYLKSKFEAEKQVQDYRSKGVNGSIYRVGNLIFQSSTGKFQKNIQDDYFYAIIRGAVKLEMITDKMKKMVFDMSFIDYTAKAIVLLLTKAQLRNEIYHLCNPYELPMTEMAGFLKELGFILNDVKEYDVEDYLSQFEGKSEYEKIIELLKLHSWIFEEKQGTQPVYKLDRTVMLLEKLGFKWPKVTKKHIERMIAHSKEVAFL
jgi:amino acid adenylation domain-containing protein/thioester reductase-like protein/non-ribosomal peptide synthase protein (TIGR01720 family)